MFASGLASFSLSATESERYTLDTDRLVAAYLFNFARFARWPDSAFMHDTTLVIGILGNASFYQEFSISVAKRSIANHPVKALTINNANELPDSLHLLYIKEPSPEQLSKVFADTEKTPSLIVVDSHQCPNIDHHICLSRESKKVTFSVDLPALRHRSLELDGRILRLAIRIKR
jgi:hypothetical protein